MALHANDNKRTLDFKNVKVIRTVNNEKRREFLEMVEIDNNQNTINREDKKRTWKNAITTR